MTDDGIADQATTFAVCDVADEQRLDGSESKREQYRRLSITNKSARAGKWRDERKHTRQDIAAVVNAIASQLELTDFQRERAHHYLTQLDPDRQQGYRSVTIALCVCGIAGRRDGRSYHPNHVAPGGEVPSETVTTFVQIATDNGVRHTALYHCWSAIKRDLA